jgi:hypothetical protein
MSLPEGQDRFLVGGWQEEEVEFTPTEEAATAAAKPVLAGEGWPQETATERLPGVSLCFWFFA